jgi:hypothetical protein
VGCERRRRGGGVYSYSGTGTETISVPPKSQSEGPGIPGTIVRQAGGCFEFRLDFSDFHWQSCDYCVRDGMLVSPTRAGYYNWDFVAFHVDDTSTFVCSPRRRAGHVLGRAERFQRRGHVVLRRDRAPAPRDLAHEGVDSVTGRHLNSTRAGTSPSTR